MMRTIWSAWAALLGLALGEHTADELENHRRALGHLPKIVLPRDGSVLSFLANGTSGRAKATGTGTGSSPSPTAITDTSCGETSTPFTIKVGQKGGLFDGWFMRASANGMLFTSEEDSASEFSVEGSGHLCVVGKGTEETGPYILGIEGQNGKRSSPIWSMGVEFVEDQEPYFMPLSCAKGSGQLSCAEGDMERWIACGIQLAITELKGKDVPLNGLNCTSITLVAT